jgi:hypothetical protein
MGRKEAWKWGARREMSGIRANSAVINRRYRRQVALPPDGQLTQSRSINPPSLRLRRAGPNHCKVNQGIIPKSTVDLGSCGGGQCDLARRIGTKVGEDPGIQKAPYGRLRQPLPAYASVFGPPGGGGKRPCQCLRRGHRSGALGERRPTIGQRVLPATG